MIKLFANKILLAFGNGKFIPQYRYVFNKATGIPDEVEKQIQEKINSLQGQPLNFANHANDRINQKNIDINNIPHLNGTFPSPKNGFNHIEVEHDGKNITKLLMRGPLNDTHDVAMPISLEGEKPFATTVWPNKKDDGHKTLDLQRVHLPQEFQAGKGASRKLVDSQTAKMPGYQPMLHNEENVNKILNR